MKNLVIVTIEGPSHNDINGARKAIVNACVEVKDRVNNGSRIKVSSCNADDVNEIYSIMGRIKWWTLGRKGDPIKVTVKDWMKGQIVLDGETDADI